MNGFHSSKYSRSRWLAWLKLFVKSLAAAAPPPSVPPRLAWLPFPPPKLKRQQALSSLLILAQYLSTSTLIPLPLSSHYHATPPRLQHSSFTLLKEPGLLSHYRAGLSLHF
jgi:hypothetical protein